MRLSKTRQLGLIIVGLRLLRQWKVPVRGLVSRVVKLFGVSPKSAHEAAERIVERLGEEPQAEGARDWKRELFELRIRVQVLTYEREHPGVRFAERGRHLPEEARSLCVRIFRDFRSELCESRIAGALGVPLSNIRRWAKEAQEDCTFPEKPEKRGVHRRATPEDARRVVKEYKALEKSLTLEEFAQSYGKKYPERPLDRRTITRILQREGLVRIKPEEKGKKYHDDFEVYFPGAQAAIDATECTVTFTGEVPQQFKVVKEVAIDVATCAILGDALESTENADGVESVVVRVREECRSILALLSDNGSANRAEKVQEELEQNWEVGQIFTFRRHPQTNGHLEGLFGQFARVVGHIEIDDSSREALAASIVEVVFGVFCHFHNHSPRKRLGCLSPLEYLRRYVPEDEEREVARRGLQKRKERSERLKRPNPRLSDVAFGERVEALLERNGFDLDLQKALKALVHFDDQVISSASWAFFSQSHRQGFDEDKRTFAYFMGIVRNKQKEIDEVRLRSQLEFENSRSLSARYGSDDRRVQEERAQEEDDLRHRPENIVLEYARLFLSTGLRWMAQRCTEKIHSALEALRDLGRGSRREIDQLAATIRSWGEFAEELKEEMIRLLDSEYDAVAAQVPG